MRGAFVRFDPYRSLAASVVTSNVIDQRDAFDLSVSVHTTAGSTSTFTWQISNHSVVDGIPEASWSAFTVVIPSTATYLQPPLGFRYARIVRTVSDASFVFNIQKQVR